ncbi:MAG: hypothetical protein H6668_22365 [Ardenticatenaceae bacterium]|nr:hypothetical protein [Ardenticatenaceae bacterium]
MNTQTQNKSYTFVLFLLGAAIALLFSTQMAFAAPAEQTAGTGTVTIVTASDPTGTTGFFYFGQLGSFTQDDGQSQTFSNLTPGTYDIYQSVQAGWVLDISCVGGSNTPLNNGTTITLGADEDITCTFANTDVGGSITVVTASNPAGGTGFYYFGQVGVFTQDDGQSHVTENLLPGNYDIIQTIPAGYDLSVSCVGGDSTPLAEGVTVQLDANEDIVCTFANSNVGGTITIVAAGADGLEYYGSLGQFILHDGQSEERTALSPGEYSVYQGVPAGYVLGVSCDGGSYTALSEGVTINLGASEHITCTFTNTDVGGSITIVAASDPVGATGFEYYGNMGQFTLNDGDSEQRTNLMPGEYTVYQGVPAGYVLGVSCTGGDYEAQAEGVIITLDANEDIVCTFTNTDVGGSITIIAASDPAGAAGFEYYGNMGQFTLDDGDSEQRTNLMPGEYTVYQGVPAGYVLDLACTGGDYVATAEGVIITLAANEDIVCTFTNTDVGGTVTIVAASNPAGAAGFSYYGNFGQFLLGDGQSEQRVDQMPGEYTVYQGIPAGYVLDVACTGGDFVALAEGVTVTLNANEDIVCTFTNTYVGGSITIEAVSQPAGGTGFGYYGSLGQFELNDGENEQRTDLMPGEYTIYQGLQAGLDLSIGCTGGDFTALAEGVTVTLDANEDVVCTFTNSDNSGPTLGNLFFDDFESDLGWTVNPNGSNSATTGMWERANPQHTHYYGPLQLGRTVSGDYDLVTGGAAGSDPGSYDVDGGVTSVRSPNITLPSSGDITLSFAYYLAHLENASNSDFLRVSAVGDTTAVIFEKTGAAYRNYAEWEQFSASLNAFAGQTVYLLVEAADNGAGSLIEAALDDVSVDVIEIAFFDDFETSQGWTVNANGGDSATTGMWERADAQWTDYYGTLQRGRAASGNKNLVTGALAGTDPGSYDVDNGVTSIQSPSIVVPSDGNITLSFAYYLAHLNNSSADDFLRVSVVGSTTTVVFEERGAANWDYAYRWEEATIDLSDFAGQTIHLLIEAADNGTASLVEAGIDDVAIIATGD